MPSRGDECELAVAVAAGCWFVACEGGRAVDVGGVEDRRRCSGQRWFPVSSASAGAGDDGGIVGAVHGLINTWVVPSAVKATVGNRCSPGLRQIVVGVVADVGQVPSAAMVNLP